ncbi:MAG: glycosyltransferase family 4 protein [Chthoniobacterales bacterium]
MPDLEIHIVSCTQQAMESPTKLSDNTWFHLLHVPKIGWLRTGYQGCIRAARKKLREIRPDVVHGQGTERECGLTAAFSGFPNVITIHGNVTQVARAFHAPFGSFWWCTALLERLTLPRAGGVLCNSSYTESLVRPLARRTWRMPNAVRREFFETPLPIGSTARKPILLNIGSVIPFKRQLELLDLAADLHRAGHLFEFHFIGTANPKDAYARAFLDRMRALQDAGFARHIEMIKVSELIQAFDAASALVHLPSEEAFGLVVAEALSRNLKLFAGKVGGISDIADGVEGAELFQLDDPAALQRAIEEWLRADCPRPKSAALEMRSRYHPAIIAEKHREVYQEVISERSLSPVC